MAVPPEKQRIIAKVSIKPIQKSTKPQSKQAPRNTGTGCGSCRRSKPR